MDLTSSDNEACYFWVVEHAESGSVDDLSYRIPTRKFHLKYVNEMARNRQVPVDASTFWEVLQLAFSGIQIIGRPGGRAFAGIREKP